MRICVKSKLALAVMAASVASTSMVNAQEPVMEEVVVQGFRASLEKALDAKRDSVNVSDSIMAEDIGKFPDLNLAESLQRVPGVTITREGGEGRQITLRGLPPSFTRTTLNGMEVPAAGNGLDASGGVNLGRAFDFNVFASELFSRIDVQKSPAASIEEGGIAGSVDLSAPMPFDKPGLNGGISLQGAFNTTFDTQDPRFAGVISNTFAEDKFGVLASIAYTERTVRQEGFGSVRFSYPGTQGEPWSGLGDLTGLTQTGSVFSDREINGGEYLRDSQTGELLLDANGDPIFEALDGSQAVWYPRLPRTDYFGNDQQRTGVTIAFQARPTDDLELSLSYMAAALENNREAYNLFAQFRSNWDSITPTSLNISPDRVAVGGTFENVVVRSETRVTSSETDFNQLVFSGEYVLNDNITIDAMYGSASSEFTGDYYRINLNSPATTFSYDFTQNSNIAAMQYGYDVADVSLYTPTSPDAREWKNTRDNDTFRLDVDFDYDSFNVKAGLIANTREVKSDYYRSNGSSFNTDASTVSADQIGTVLPVSDFGAGLDAPADFPGSWAVIDVDSAKQIFGIGDLAFQATRGETFDVTESTMGFYVELNNELELGGRPFRSNVGIRWAETETEVASADFKVERSYDDVLPAINLAYELTDEVQLRASYGESITRPGLNSLRVNNSYGLTTGRVSGGNPDLDPIRASNFDLGVEWYFAEESVLGINYFTKDIEGLLVTDNFTGRIDPAIAAVLVTENFDPIRDFDPRTEDYEFSVPINAGTSDFTGYELFYQQPFTFLPGALQNFGVIANYTSVEADTNLNGEIVEFENLSESLYNGTLYYETDKWGVRLSVASRDDYLTDVTGSNGNAEHGTTGNTQYDMSAFYNLNDYVTFTFEGVNLTDEHERLFTTGDGTKDMVRQYTHTGTILFLGVRANF